MCRNIFRDTDEAKLEAFKPHHAEISFMLSLYSSVKIIKHIMVINSHHFYNRQDSSSVTICHSNTKYFRGEVRRCCYQRHSTKHPSVNIWWQMKRRRCNDSRLYYDVQSQFLLLSSWDIVIQLYERKQNEILCYSSGMSH